MELRFLFQKKINNLKKYSKMKTVALLIVSSLFLSNVPNNKENDSIKKVMALKIGKTDKIKVENITNPRTPIIIVKND